MKKLITAAALLFATMLQAQVEFTVNKSPYTDVWKSGSKELKMHIVGTDTTYTMFFQNEQYTHITDIQSINMGTYADVLTFANITKDMENKQRISSQLYDVYRGSLGFDWWFQISKGNIFFTLSPGEIKNMQKAVKKIQK